jgi:hypothetical protein
MNILSKDKYINSHCVISQRLVQKNGRSLFENKQEDLPAFLLSVYNNAGLNYPRFYKMDNLCKLGWLASEFLLEQNCRQGNYLPEEKGLVISNSNASLDTDLKYFGTVEEDPGPSLFVYTLPNILVGEICICNNIKGETAFFVSETFDTPLMEQYVSWLLDNNRLKTCIMGWVDVLNEDHKAVLMEVGNNKEKNSIPFTIENINNIFHSEHG